MIIGNQTEKLAVLNKIKKPLIIQRLFYFQTKSTNQQIKQ